MSTNVSRGTIPEHPITLTYRQQKPERFIEDICRAREHHTQKKFVPRAMNFSLETISRWKPAAARPRPEIGRAAARSPSTMRLNRTNVKRKPSARGRTR